MAAAILAAAPVAPVAPVAPPIQVNGRTPSKMTPAMNKLSLLPIRNIVTMRDPTRTFIGNASRMSNEEAWVGTERGTVNNPQCSHCKRGIGPSQSVPP